MAEGRPSQNPALYRVLGLLEGVRPSGAGYSALCPAHADHDRSLSVGLGLNGGVVLCCHKAPACTVEAICAAIGLGVSDLFERDRDGHPVRRFSLIANGKVRAVHARVDRPDGKGMWFEQPNGRRGLNGTAKADLPLYREPDLLAAPAEARVFVCEGEAKADALAERGLLAVGTATGAGEIPCDAALRPLLGHEVVLWPDNDEGGRAHMARIAERLAELG